MDLFARKIHNVDNKELAEQLYPVCRKILDQTEYDNRYLFGKTTFWQNNLVKENLNEFKNFFKFVETQSIIYLNELDIDVEDKKLIIKDFWVSEMYKGGCHSLHNHSPSSHISGNFYVYAEPKSSTITFVRDGLSDFKYDLKKKKYTKYNSLEWSFEPTAGKMLIWESDLLHRVDQNISNSRIAITFNIKIT